MTLRAVTALVEGVHPVSMEIALQPGEALVAWEAAPLVAPGSPAQVDWRSLQRLALPAESHSPGITPYVVTLTAEPLGSGTWAVTAFVESFTGQQVKRPAPGGAGHV